VSASNAPLVSVLTPVYNGEDFLAECIESVLRQTYQNFEYIIVNNCSTDRSLEIARHYASDPRIRVHSNTRFVGVIENHNIAFSLMSPVARYCKVVSADDLIFAECVARMVEVAELNPSVGIVGCYQLAGDTVIWQGFTYPRAVMPGREMCRKVFLEAKPLFGFGTPTSIMYRADLVRSRRAFYPNSSPHSDTSACFEHLRHSDFGFVYRVLCYQRIHRATQSSTSAVINRYASAYLSDLIHYGPTYLNQDELERLVKARLAEYHRFLALSLIPPRGKDFWAYHRARLEELGYPLTAAQLLKAAAVTLLRETLNPEEAIRKVWRKFVPAADGVTPPARRSPTAVGHTSESKEASSTA
jgi:glycosyltransferase involved in cell wall biosynthesis